VSTYSHHILPFPEPSPAPSAPRAVLEIEDLTIAFPGAPEPVVRNASLSVAERQIVAIVGESGSGKTLTSLSAVGLLPPSARIGGRVRVGGVDVIGAEEQVLRKLRGGTVGMIFQEPMTSLNPVMKIGRQIAEVVELHGGLDRQQVRPRVIELLDAVGITRPSLVANQYPHELSGGMKQRIMIGMALAGRPRLLIADEPTTALDATIQVQVLELILKVARDLDASVLLVTHDFGLVAEVADDVVVMNRGEVVERAGVFDIFRRPRHSYTRHLLDSLPRIDNGPEPVAAVPSGETAAPPLLKVEGLSKTYRSKANWLAPAESTVALADIDLRLEEGRTLGIVGESGSGKSTLGHLIAGLVAPDAGSIVYEGAPVRPSAVAQRSAFRANVQFMFQDPYSSLNPRMTVRDIVTEPLIVQHLIAPRETADRAADLLQQVGLPTHFGDRLPHELSGGQRQRVGLARAISTHPKLVICDEPVSALDVSVQTQILKLLKKLQEDQGIAYIFIAHGLEGVHFMSNDIAVMRHGKIVEYGPRYQVFNDPQHPYTRRLLSAMMVPDPERSRFRGAADGRRAI
jgi:peptide/nickel transport system ATP-binding protein